jgi:DNA-binding YbaB/EbfC family protein
MFKGMSDLVAQAGKMREEMARMQELLAQRTLEVAQGGVRVSANGKQQILSISIDPALIQSQNKEKLEALVLSVVNDAMKASQAMVSEEMSRMSGGVGALKSMLGVS